MIAHPPREVVLLGSRSGHVCDLRKCGFDQYGNHWTLYHEPVFGPTEPPEQRAIDLAHEFVRKLKGDRPVAKMRALLTVQTVTIAQYGETLKFSAQYSNNKEDNSYAEATPSASAEFQISNKALHGQFKPGQKFYVDFTPVE